ncbi:MAG TPA: hypothetical protein VIY08_03265 [Candidatus Nitrosocosmicus sp.]
MLLNYIGSYISKVQLENYFVSSLLPSKISLFWNIIDQIPDTEIFEVITANPSQGYIPDIEGFLKILTARTNTKLFIEAVRKRNLNSNTDFKVLDISAVLMTLIVRSEAHEHYLRSILTRTEKKIQTNIDVQQLLSVEDKVQKNAVYHPDIRAIRDATAHSYFKIDEDKNNDFIITFNNFSKGWKFYKKFTRSSLLNFYQDFDRQFNLYTLMLSIKLLFAFLNLNFKI